MRPIGKTFVSVGLAALAAAAIAAPASAKDTVKVGFIGPLTGGVSANGLGGRNSADLAVKLRNADAEAKYNYDIVVFDDECKPNVAVQVATKMAADKDIIGGATHYCSATAIATVDTYHKFGFPVIVWGAVLPDVTYRNKYAEIHRVNGTMINQNDANAELISQLGYKTVAVIHDTTDYGKGHNEYFSKALAKIGKAQIVGTFGVTADQQDFATELTRIKALKPDVIYFGGLTPIGVRIRSQMDKLGINAVFDGTSGIVSDAYIQGLGPLAEGTLAFREGAPTDKLPGGKFFMEKYTAQKYDQPPEAYGAFAFAAMNMLIDSIEKVGPDRKKVIADLANVKDRDSIVGKITFDDHGQNAVPVITKYVVQDGKFVEWDDSEYASGKRKLPGQK
ncbi:branched-chain amino acid ABC transporter substrate-binding protein [Rhodoplanes sp. Z2-YC6860]|uniref:branched-chain amino acid ABC transporter substrate-binding protein n=1 Tax=Rhodoplanes sp. Z2-YC6860 TaxID=674703 RepID=UPI00078C1791|nr:branched-chain amino acid ABC transporter substrate-binding protein [Rhodoplanes sp. Z2-YC6860]AMN38691.1 branched-chain amino acid ABC transporter substrate-binding protein [Rhodoplanes sp. Z2-YC6860]